MKTKNIFNVLAATVLLTSSICAQEESTGKFFLGLSGGVSAPLGNFSSTDLGEFGSWNNTSGFAKTGFNIGFDGAYYFHKNIGVGGVLNFSDHGGLTKDDATKLGDSYTDAFGVDESTAITNSRYRTLNFLVGPYFSLPFNKFSLEARALGGLTQSISTPEVSVQLEDNPAFTQMSSTASAFGWQLGLGIKYSFSEKMALSLMCDYFSTPGVAISNENRNNTAGRLVTNQQMSWINGSLGLAYKLK